MTPEDSALSAVLERLTAGDAVDVLREVLQAGLQRLIEEQATAGSARTPRGTDMRVNERNGGRERLLATPGGDVVLRIPKVGQGSFFWALLEPRVGSIWLCAVIIEAYIHGTSVRKVGGYERVDESGAARRDYVAARCSFQRFLRPTSSASAAAWSSRVAAVMSDWPMSSFRGSNHPSPGR